MIDLKPACRRMTDLLAAIADDQLVGPTPCAEYTVGDLIDHVDEAAHGFAALAGNDLGERADTGSQPTAANLGDDWRRRVAKHVRVLGEAWDDPAAWRGSSGGAGVELPNEVWGKIALTEMVVHGWDLAKATGQPFGLPEETLRACHEHVAEFVPNAPIESLWGRAVETRADAPLLDRIVAITGRTP
ncbi:TIGR03086 family metal-binding protein [Saccharopolyspora sp. NPDC050389]|uniref:TIGR03086 family metal-binding protein n=1 Tax=Saccharopolyspora sp. NPDC050389 TaxID=3155516 RepID=UPI003400C307